jgi:hypothetical protein
MKHLSQKIVLIAALLVLVSAGSVSTQEPPPLPSSFYGSVSASGQNVLSGTQI